MKTTLIHHIQKYIPLDKNAIETIVKYVEPLFLSKKEYLLREGETCKYYCFVKKGCLRMFYNNNKGLEQITQFAIEDWWIADYFSVTNLNPSAYNIQAVEASEILLIDKLAFDKLTEELPVLERYFRIMAERTLAASQFRLKLIFDLSKEEMYLHFNSMFPAFTQRIPQYMIASYLGISPEYLSEIRRKNP